ncbi:hypothetical protein RV11_GL000539 [Enterococcus phoeniculicola]|nr:hypothetical protein RV11_GL000539 [Enterococcus phoeniculicola]
MKKLKIKIDTINNFFTPNLSAKKLSKMAPSIIPNIAELPIKPTCVVLIFHSLITTGTIDPKTDNSYPENVMTKKPIANNTL